MVKDIERLLVILNKLSVIRGRTRFQKIIFLLKQKDKIHFGYNFIPYYYGPYSRDLQLELNLLEAAGYVQVTPKGGYLYVHCLTEEGKKAAREVEHKMEKSERDELSATSKSYQGRSTPSLISEAKKLATASA